MMRVTRRSVIASALAVPTVAGLASWRWAHGEGAVLLHDPSLAAGRRFAEAGMAAGGTVLALEGDPIWQVRSVLREKPALIAGISRHSDALLIEEAAGEGGYDRVASFDSHAARCTAADCRPGWHALGRMALSAGEGWAEVLAIYAARAGRPGEAPLPTTLSSRADPGRVFGWLLVPR